MYSLGNISGDSEVEGINRLKGRGVNWLHLAIQV